MIFYLMMFVHFVADFLAQSRKMGKLKASHPLWLLFHIGIIFIFFLPFGVKFSMMNAVGHLIVDAVLWNAYKLSVKIRHPKARAETFKYWGDKWFYSTIGFDQFLHYATLWYCYQNFY